MKKNRTKTIGYQITDIILKTILLASIIAIVFVAKGCTEKKRELDEMRVYHSDKGILEERDNILILRK